ncbi:hypothetical protein HRR83_001971 [Exophiala dermatitidis]|nr:hypothetical protein HRR73_005407 [Exophiala dermatitidis]KAJ4523854.1 hypothetical protein HRR74_002048 [Exophiala dermatitidis]KAJ4537206.1 hypothetical protein HRR76_005220 [Exophiala dermatitidis]KAJ4555195.1 hypothetical protein HRR77_001135 [Exophiala dermatitidis]KAJ4566378.1 hypothetical protein HRR79_005385 [Exophiala dermatitidis]
MGARRKPDLKRGAWSSQRRDRVQLPERSQFEVRVPIIHFISGSMQHTGTALAPRLINHQRTLRLGHSPSRRLRVHTSLPPRRFIGSGIHYVVRTRSLQDKGSSSGPYFHRVTFLATSPHRCLPLSGAALPHSHHPISKSPTFAWASDSFIDLSTVRSEIVP